MATEDTPIENIDIEGLNIESITIPQEFELSNPDETKHINIPPVLFFIGTELAKGAIAWVGGKIMDYLFSSSSADLGDAIDEIVKRVAVEIRQAIQDSVLQQTVTQVKNAQTALDFYLNAPTITRLELITNNIHNATGQLHSMGLAAHPSYMDAVCFYLIVMQERANLFADNRRGELYNMVKLIMQAREYQAVEVPKLWRNWNLQGYDVFPDKDPLGDFVVVKWKKEIPGGKCKTIAEGQKFIQKHAEAVYLKDIYPHYVKGGDEIINQLVPLFYAIRHSLGNNDFRLEYIAENTRRFAAGQQPI